MEKEFKMKMQESSQKKEENNEISPDQRALNQSLAYSFILLVVMFILIFC